MADDHRAAGEVFQRLLQGPDRVHVQVVGRLVEQEHVRAALEHPGEVHAVALAAGEDADRFLLVRAGESESRDVRPAVHFDAVPSLNFSSPSAIACQTVSVVLQRSRATARRTRA